MGCRPEHQKEEGSLARLLKLRLEREWGTVMEQGRGSATSGRVLGMGVLVAALLLSLLAAAESAEFTVGDARGWTFNVEGWPAGKRFRAGDVLVFKYDPRSHNVVAVDGAGYRACAASPGSKVYTSGNDRIPLARGANYFICSFPGHCQAGMKIAVPALWC